MRVSVPLILRGVTILCGIISLGFMATLYKYQFAFSNHHRVEKFNFAVIIISLIFTIALAILSFLGRNKDGPMATVDVGLNLLCGTLTAMGWIAYLFLYQQITEAVGPQNDAHKKLIGYKSFKAKAICTLIFEFVNMVLYPAITILIVRAPPS